MFPLSAAEIAELLDFIDVGLVILKVILVLVTLISLSIFYSRWKFVKKNYTLYVGINLLGISFVLDYAQTVDFLDFDGWRMLSNVAQFLFCLSLAMSYYKMMKITETGKEKPTQQGDTSSSPHA